MVKEFHIEEKVLFMGEKRNVNEYLQAMDVFVFPSKCEGFPLALVEAQAAGLCCFVSKNVTKEIAITDGVYYLSLEKTEEEWAKEILNNRKRNQNADYEVTKAGYEIEKETKELERYYCEMRNCNIIK